MAIDVNAAMDAIGVALATISGMRVYDYPPPTVEVPAAVVAYPDVIEFDAAFVRGADRAVFPVHILVGRFSDRTARDQLNSYIPVVKAALDGGLVGGSARVTEARPNIMSVAAVDYLAATFSLEVYA